MFPQEILWSLRSVNTEYVHMYITFPQLLQIFLQYVLQNIFTANTTQTFP